MEKKEFATLAVFSSLERAQVVKSMLDSMGIESQLIDDTGTRVLPMLPEASRIKIIVNAGDYDKAGKVLSGSFDAADFAAEWRKADRESPDDFHKE